MNPFDVSVNEEQYAALTQWALLLPKFKKTRGYLREGEGHCCIGAACSLSLLGSWEKAGRFSRYLGDLVDAPEAIQEHFGFEDSWGFKIPLTLIREFFPFCSAPASFMSLAEFNDSPVSGDDHTLTARILQAFIERHVKISGEHP